MPTHMRVSRPTNGARAARSSGPRILITGFGPFPGAPENPTSALVSALAASSAEAFPAASLRAQILPTDYRRSWAALRRIYATEAPDVVLHFGLSRSADAIMIETLARRRIDPGTPDAAGFAPRLGFARRTGPARIAATVPADHLVAALRDAGISSSLSQDCGSYVCNATFYRSLLQAIHSRRLVGFIHVPPIDGSEWTLSRLVDAGAVVVSAACSAWLQAGLNSR